MATAPRPRASLAIAFGAVMLASSALNNVFVTYYLEVFTQLPPAAFVAGQLLFACWNAANDPLFGWLSDHSGLRRAAAIRWGGRLWCAAFLLVWFPPLLPPAAGAPGAGSAAAPSLLLQALAMLHFTLALCLYDGALTFVELNHSALLSDNALGRTQGERASANAWAGAAAGLGSGTSLAAFLCWNGAGDLRTFRVFAAVLAAVCLVIFEASASVLDGAPSAARPVEQAASIKSASSADDSADGKGHSAAAAMQEPGVPTFRVFLGQVASQRNFLVFATMSALQVFDCTFEKNFFAPFLDVLAPPTSGVASAASGAQVSVLGVALPRVSAAELRGVVIGLSFLLPHAITVLTAPLISSRGLFSVVRSIFLLRLALILAALAVGYASLGPHLVLLFMLANRVASEAVCRLTPLVVADIADEDAFLHLRPVSVSASLVGTAAFPGKLSQSFAPILGYALMPHSARGGAGARATTVWALLVGVPLATVVAQLGLWSGAFTLHGAYLRTIKARVEAGEGEAAVARID